MQYASLAYGGWTNLTTDGFVVRACKQIVAGSGTATVQFSMANC